MNDLQVAGSEGSGGAVFRAITEQARLITGASYAHLLVGVGDGFRVVAAAGQTDSTTIGQLVEARGARSFSVASGQAVALIPRPDDLDQRGIAGNPAVPLSVLVASAGRAVLEVADKVDAAAFDFGDIEELTALVEIAAAAVTDSGSFAESVPDPIALHAGLVALRRLDPMRYREIALLLGSLLGSLLEVS